MARGAARYPWEDAPLHPRYDMSKVKPVALACLQRDPAARPSAATLKNMVDELGLRTRTQQGTSGVTVQSRDDGQTVRTV